MTHEEIMKMEPGRELNRLVAIMIMGYEESRMKDGFVRKGSYTTLPRSYSTDMSAAFEAWTHDVPERWFMELTYSDGMYIARICEKVDDFTLYKTIGRVIARSAEEAMIKCRLLAGRGNDLVVRQT